MDWFRFYHDVLDDAKVDALDGETYKRWVKLLCLASQSKVRGVLPDAATVSYRLRISLNDTRDLVKLLRRGGLLDRAAAPSVGAIHNWEKRQPKSDNVAERVAIHRANLKLPSIKEVTPEGVTRNVTGNNPPQTPPTERDSESEGDSLPLKSPSHGAGAATSPGGKTTAPVDALWAALADACGNAETQSQRRTRVGVYRELADAGAEAGDVALRAVEFRHRYRVPLTDKALAAHWGELATPYVPAPQANGRTGGASAVDVQEQIYQRRLTANGTAPALPPPPPRQELSA